MPEQATGGSTGPRPARCARAAGAVALLAVLIATLVTAAAPARAQTPGLRVDGTATYRLEPSDGRVHVTVEVELVNTMPSRTRGAFIETPYFDSFAFPAVGPVTDATARSSGRDLPVRVEPEADGVEAVVVDLVPNLVHGAPQTVSVAFDLPGQPSRSESVTRVNEAFAAWLLVAPDPAVEVVVDLPEAFEATFGRDVPAAISQREGRRVYRLPPPEDPDALALFATARDDERFDTREVSVDGREITVEAWPDDPEWAGFTVDTVERGLPVLSDTLGLELPDRELTVLESTGGYHLGYAGIYLPDLDVIEVGDELDRVVMLHELAHLWVNPNLFADRWIFEGMAEEVAHRAAHELGEPETPPEPIDPDDPAAVALSDWGDPSVLDPEQHAVETYAYNAAYAVVHELVGEIGRDAFRDVIAVAHDRRIAYAREGGEAERTHLSDWRYLYDLLDLVGGSERARDLFVQHVLNGEQVALLDGRDDAREALEGLERAAWGWEAPLAVREQISRWRFDRTRQLVDEAHELVDRVEQLAERLEPLDVDPRAPIRTSYETVGDLDDLGARIGRFERLGDGLAEVHRRRDAADPVQRLGLVGTGDTLDAARTAYGEGRLEPATELLAQASRSTDRATLRGSALLVALVLLTSAAVVHARARSSGS